MTTPYRTKFEVMLDREIEQFKRLAETTDERDRYKYALQKIAPKTAAAIEKQVAKRRARLWGTR